MVGRDWREGLEGLSHPQHTCVAADSAFEIISGSSPTSSGLMSSGLLQRRGIHHERRGIHHERRGIHGAKITF